MSRHERRLTVATRLAVATALVEDAIGSQLAFGDLAARGRRTTLDWNV